MNITDTVSDIPDIPEVPKEILVAASNGKLVLFIGAGVSRIIGCPSWQDFSINYLRYVYENKLINYYEYENLAKLQPRKLLSICKSILKEKNVRPPDIKNFFKVDKELKKKYKIFESIYAFNCIYITTNYDDNLDQIAEKSYPKTSTETTILSSTIERHEKRYKPIYTNREDLLVSNLNNGAVIHIHGSVNDEKSMIMTITDYMQYYKINSEPTVLLEEIFKSYTVLFVGYGLEEYEILEFMISKSQTAKGELKHFMLYPTFRKEINLLKFQIKYYTDLGIQLVPYPIDDNGYEHLATVVDKWAKQIGPIAKPQCFLDRIKLIDEVI
ncbi:MAG: SIR2 family protein [Endomicrobiia bacterium]